MMHQSTVLVALLGACAAAQAAEGMAPGTFSLRAAEEPDAKEWAQGASLSYVAKDGKATWQTDAVVKVGWEWARSDAVTPGQPLTFGVTTWGLELGPYLHRLDGSDAPVNDRGLSVRLSMFRVPAGPATGAVVSYAADVVGSGGTTLKERSGTPAGQFDNVDAKRVVATLSMYYQRADNWFLRLSGGGYSDHVSGSPGPGVNGRETGLHGSVQLSISPLGLLGTRVGPYALVPLLTLKAQKQSDRSATDSRTRNNYELYTALLSLPLAFGDSKRSGFVPSLDISRSVGADLLAGRARSGITRVALALKY
jgi:hypothetical protein